MEKAMRELSSRFDTPRQVDSSSFGTTEGVLSNITRTRGTDPVTDMLESVAHTASGELGGVGSLIHSDTMGVANQIASGVVDTSGELTEGILGDTSEVLAGEMFREYGGEYRGMKPRPSVSISVTVSAPAVCAAATTAATGAMEMVSSAMDKGIAKIQSLTAIVGSANGAIDLLTSSVQKALDQ
jgi:hypothetical protein